MTNGKALMALSTKRKSEVICTSILCHSCEGRGRVWVFTGQASGVCWATPWGEPEEKEILCPDCGGEGWQWVALELEPLCLESPRPGGSYGTKADPEEIEEELAWLLHSGDLGREDYDTMTAALGRTA